MGLLNNIGRITRGIVTVNGNDIDRGVNGLANQFGDVFNRALGQTQANQWQWDMWNAQNEYNTPAAQRARLEAAGYNPMLMNSAGSSASGNAGSMTAKSGHGVSPFEILNTLVSAQTGLSQASLIAEQARALKHDNDLIDGTPVKSNDNSLFGKLGRFFNWSGTDEGQKLISDAKEKVGGIFQGAAVPKSPERIIQDEMSKQKVPRVLKENLVRMRPGERLDEAIRRSEILASGMRKAPRKKSWNGKGKGKYTNFAP